VRAAGQPHTGGVGGGHQPLDQEFDRVPGGVLAHRLQRACRAGVADFGRQVLRMHEARVLRAAAAGPGAGAGGVHQLQVVVQAVDAGIGRLADVVGQHRALPAGAVRVGGQVQQDRADVHGEQVELQVEAFDPAAVISQFAAVPRRHPAGAGRCGAAAVVDGHVLHAELGRQAQAALVRLEKLFADIHVDRNFQVAVGTGRDVHSLTPHHRFG